ncbi:MAG: thermonuclease family protein [Rubrivivax sp.]|nr:thermonuclease family protein [Rubrivivax sp.]
MKNLLAVALLAATLLALPAVAAPLQGQVTKLFDGDSFIFQPAGGGKPLEVRLKDIDAPEICQAGGPAARDFLQDYVRDKTVRIETLGKDTYGRTLAVLTVDEMNINQRMVAEGHAWSARTKWNQGPLVSQERMAQALKRGLHATPGAVMPSEFRKQKGPCGGDAASAPTAGKATPTAPAAPTMPAPVATGKAVPARCDGRTHCSQMTSCAEARYFLANCPGVKMDGNNDGVPCEQQWCR